MNLVGSELADVIVIQHLYEAEGLFDGHHRGRLFAVFRHPIERAVSMFYYLQYGMFQLNQVVFFSLLHLCSHLFTLQ